MLLIHSVVMSALIILFSIWFRHHFIKILGFRSEFQFAGADQAFGDQEQTVSCELHLDPVDNSVQEQADACICYNQAECANECELGTDNRADDAMCTGTADLFLCTCNDGYSGEFGNKPFFRQY